MHYIIESTPLGLSIACDTDGNILYRASIPYSEMAKENFILDFTKDMIKAIAGCHEIDIDAAFEIMKAVEGIAVIAAYRINAAASQPQETVA